MLGPFVHNIDPIIASVGPLHVWWYGLSFTLGFINAHLFIRRNRERLRLSIAKVYELSLFFAVGVLLGGRALVVLNNEWSFYREYLELIPAIWVGGFATHGLILGGSAAVLIFCRVNGVPIRPVLDVLAVSAAIILAFGRIGNFIDGQIYGSLTDMPWGVKFPNVDGFRHPVVLYDGLKNLLLMPLLLWLRRWNLAPGRLAILFVIAYSGLRIPIDLFREYPITTLGIPTGQTLNLFMLGVGVIALLVNIYRNRKRQRSTVTNIENTPEGNLGIRKLAFAVALLVPIVIPSDATRDVIFTYRARHAGLEHSLFYPPIQDDLMRTAETPRDR